ncbi:MAG: molybdopterin molybdotransferase MoeA [Pseudomonadota bacterium]
MQTAESKVADPSCEDEFDPALLPVAEALRRVLAQLQPITGKVRLGLRDALGRVLSEDIVSPVNVPSHTNSAMDGYAIKSGDIPESGQRKLTLAGTSWAGRPFEGTVNPGKAVRIMTGAVMPDDTDTVVIQEQVERTGDEIEIGTGHEVGQNVRTPGEDIKQGELILPAGKALRPTDLGLLASLGIPEVIVARKVRVAFFSTGDELRNVGQPLGKGQIYDSSRYTLHALLKQLDVEILDMGIVRDEPEAVKQAFLDATEQADVLLTTGGVSVGDADFVKETLEAVGQVSFWKIAMKPGRPLAFGKVKNTWFFGLPGNPVSSTVTFIQFVKPAMYKLMGIDPLPQPKTLKARTLKMLKKQPGRMDFQRGILDKDENGEWIVHSTGAQGSHILSSVSKANCFIVLPLESGNVEAGSWVDVELMDE